jgi:hypothetical protein
MKIDISIRDICNVFDTRAALAKKFKAADLDEIKRLYLEALSTRDRSFHVYENKGAGEHVLAVDNGGGFFVCEVSEMDGCAVLIAALLNFAAKLADCYDASGSARPA